MNRILVCPYLRKSIQDYFEILLDKEFQKRWFDSNYKHAFWDSLMYYVFDYLAFYGDESDIGSVFYNKDEADAISEYLEFFNDAFEANMPDSYYINHSKWPKLLEEAKRIIEMIKENNIKYNLENDMKLWEKEMEEKRIRENS